MTGFDLMPICIDREKADSVCVQQLIILEKESDFTVQSASFPVNQQHAALSAVTCIHIYFTLFFPRCVPAFFQVYLSSLRLSPHT